MATKLTLRLDENLIRRAKAYAKRSGKSVSQLVAEFFDLLGSRTQERQFKLTPTVKFLKGAFRDSDLNVEDYKKHLEEKYL